MTVDQLKQAVKDQKALCQEIWATASAHSEEYRAARKRYNYLANRLTKLTHPRQLPDEAHSSSPSQRPGRRDLPHPGRAGRANGQDQEQGVMVKFDITPEEDALVQQIIERADALEGGLLDRLDLDMILTAVNANGCPLDFAKLLAFDDFSFAHDISGIAACIDRRTGELQPRFLPRCAK